MKTTAIKIGWSILLALLTATSTAVAFSYHRGIQDSSYLTREEATKTYATKESADERYQTLTNGITRVENKMDQMLITLQAGKR
jgi:hypothetical protein